MLLTDDFKNGKPPHDRPLVKSQALSPSSSPSSPPPLPPHQIHPSPTDCCLDDPYLFRPSSRGPIVATLPDPPTAVHTFSAWTPRASSLESIICQRYHPPATTVSTRFWMAPVKIRGKLPLYHLRPAAWEHHHQRYRRWRRGVIEDPTRCRISHGLTVPWASPP